jgi:Predicted metal-binding integral membrane protein (DUF2182)
MVALGWMNLLWMALFAAIIFGEKVWVKGGKWVARSTGVGFVILGVLALLGIMEIPTGDMTMTDVTGNNNKDMEMEMSNGMNMEMGIDMNMEMGIDMKMNKDSGDNSMQRNMDMKDNKVMK